MSETADSRTALLASPLGSISRIESEAGPVLLKTLGPLSWLSAEHREKLTHGFLHRAETLCNAAPHAESPPERPGSRPSPRVVWVPQTVVEVDPPSVVFAWPPGQPLSQLAGRGLSLSTKQVVQIGLQLCQAGREFLALMLAPALPDPRCLFWSEESAARLVDAGFCYAPSETMVWEQGVAPAPLHLLAPERLAGAEPTQSSYVYAVGAVLHWLLSGQWPFRGPTPVALAQSARRGVLAPNDRDGNPLDPRLVRVLRHCLAAEQSQRYQTIAALEGDLKQAVLLAEEPVGVALREQEGAGVGGEWEAEVVGPPRASPPRFLLAAGSVMLLALVVVLWAAVRRGQEPRATAAGQAKPLPLAAGGKAVASRPTTTSVPRPGPLAPLAPPQANQPQPLAGPPGGPETYPPTQLPSVGAVPGAILPAPPPIPPPQYEPGSRGRMNVQSTVEAARVFLDGVYAGTTPTTIRNVVAGRHQLSIQAEGHPEWSGEVQVTADQETVVLARIQ